jgi:hypothetical protein
LKNEIRKQNERLNKVINECGGKRYEGSDFVEDVEEMLDV